MEEVRFISITIRKLSFFEALVKRFPSTYMSDFKGENLLRIFKFGVVRLVISVCSTLRIQVCIHLRTFFCLEKVYFNFKPLILLICRFYSLCLTSIIICF